jgi:hypothetical protein
MKMSTSDHVIRRPSDKPLQPTARGGGRSARRLTHSTMSREATPAHLGEPDLKVAAFQPRVHGRQFSGIR